MLDAHPVRGRILVLGLTYFGNILADELRLAGWHAQYLPHPGRNPIGWARVALAVMRSDILYLISARIDRGSYLARLLRVRRRPVVIHWVGSDALYATRAHRAGRLSARAATRPVHWCDAPWLVDELAAIGLRAEEVKLPVPGVPVAAPPLPETFRVLMYLPAETAYRRVFDVDTLLALPARLPDIQFLILPSPAHTLPLTLPPNCAASAWVDEMDAVYRDTTVMVRLTTHDGMSFMAVESLTRARYVVWTYPMPGAIQVNGLEETVAALRDLAERHKRGELPPNHEGREITLRTFDTSTVLAELDRRLRALLPANKT